MKSTPRATTGIAKSTHLVRSEHKNTVLQDMKTAYSYIRFSTPEQAMGDSERRQLAAAEAWCARNGLTLSKDAFRDKGVSAYHGKHHETGALGRLLAHVKPGDTVLIEDCDRWSREDPLAALNRLRAEVQSGIEVVFLRTGQHVTKENFDDMAVIVPNFFGSLLANQESRKKGERVKASWDARKAGVLLGKPPRQSCPCWLEWSEKEGKPVIIEHKAETVRRVFALACAGNGVLEIIRELRRSGTPAISRSKKPTWNPTNLRRILSDRAAYGCYTQLEPPVANIWPPIVDEKTFAVAQSKLDYCRRQTVRKACAINLFTGLLKCSRCGLPVISHGTRLRCSGAYKGRSDCTFAGAPHALLETSILDFLAQTDVIRPLLSAKSAAPSKLEELWAQQDDCQRKIGRFKRLMGGDSEPSPTVYQMLKEEESRAATLAIEIEAERVRVKGESPALIGYSRFLSTLAVKATDKDYRLQLRAAIASVLESITLDPKGNSGAWLLELRLRGCTQSFLLEVVKEGWRLAGVS
jgi:DNA invertase Pin-like site-specific DNA recombinase